MMRFALVPALALLAIAPAAVAEDGQAPTKVDLVATVFAGFADGATTQLSPEPMIVARMGEGTYEARSESGATATLVAVESAPCVFDMTFSLGDQVFPVRVDVTLIEAISFETAQGMGLSEPVTPYTLHLTGPEGIAVRPKPDGTTEPLDSSPSVVTSLKPAELEAAAASLRELCPTR